MFQPRKYYHIYNRANGNENLFRNDENYRFFLQRYAYYINPIAYTYCYCLMPNHIHFLIQIKEVEEMITTFGELDKTSNKSFGKLDKTSKVFENLGGFASQQFSNLFNSYTKSYNKVFSRKGSLFVPNFKKKEVGNDLYFTRLVHYIHANPVHHGFVINMDNWQWSSYHSILSKAPTLLKRDDVLQWFGDQEGFIDFHRQAIDVKMALELE